MGFTTKKREFNQTHSYGTGEFKVLAICPSRAELNEIYQKENKEDDKEPTYIGQDAEGNKFLRVNIILENKGYNNGIQHLNMFLSDKDRTNKNGDKFEWINSRGMTSWGTDESSLPDWFTRDVQVRKAKRGEANLYRFLRAWLSKHDWYNNEDLFDLKALFKGDTKEISSLIGSEVAGNILCNILIRTEHEERDEEVVSVFREEVYDKDFLPASLLAEYKGIVESPTFQFPLTITKGEKFAYKSIKYFLKAFDPQNEYPIKGTTNFGMLKEFKPEDHPETSPETMQEADDDMPY